MNRAKNGLCGRLGWLASAAVLAAMLGGCASGGKAQYNAVLNENNELRQRNADLTSALQEANTRNAALEQENRDMAGSLDKARSGGARASGATGFEGISGVNASRGAGGDIVLEIAGEVLFDSGSVTLKSSAKQSLDKVASVIRSKYPGNMIRVEGYTDNDPIKKSSWKTNERLSAERALAVETHLVSKGLSNDQLYSAAFGPARPKATKKDSRRVEIVILAAAASS
jgi:chemotaxis protein MotB